MFLPSKHKHALDSTITFIVIHQNITYRVTTVHPIHLLVAILLARPCACTVTLSGGFVCGNAQVQTRWKSGLVHSRLVTARVENHLQTYGNHTPFSGAWYVIAFAIVCTTKYCIAHTCTHGQKYLPAGQLVHTCCPVCSSNVPAGHFSHTVRPVTAL